MLFKKNKIIILVSLLLYFLVYQNTEIFLEILDNFKGTIFLIILLLSSSLYFVKKQKMSFEIDKMKRLEQSLVHSQNLYKTLIETLPQSIYAKDRNSVYISCNKQYAELLNINPEEIQGKLMLHL